MKRYTYGSKLVAPWGRRAVNGTVEMAGICKSTDKIGLVLLSAAYNSQSCKIGQRKMLML